MKLPAVSIDEFNQKLKREEIITQHNFETFFEVTIAEAKHFAIGPYYWLIPDQSNMTIIAASPNIGQLTPYSQEEWKSQDANFWVGTMHPDDRSFVIASLAMSIGIHESLPRARAEMVRINIYCRMLNANSKYGWVLMQFPKPMFNEMDKIISTFIMTTDLSHLHTHFSRMMSLIDTSNNENIYFATQVDSEALIPLDIPPISKREYELLQLMIKGLTTPQIAKSLFISYHTVENHKRNLRHKTNTKTSAELIDFVWRNNLI
jgi:DNA-binding CsgD family transcriptional regulator